MSGGTHPYDGITLQGLRERRSMKWRAYGPDVLPAWVAETDLPLAPPIAAVLHAMVDAGDTGYADPGRAAEAFAGFSLRRWGFEPDPGRGAVVPDIMRGVLVALERLTTEGSAVAFLLPAYPPFFEVVEYARRRVVGVPLARDPDGRFVLDLDRLEAALARPEVETFLLCNPHNPTGRVFGRAELAAVAELAERHGVLVLADEVHAPLVYPGTEFTPYASLGPIAARSVSLASASKGWNVAGLKCALAFGNGAATWQAYADLSIEVLAGASPLGVAANTAAFGDGEAWLDDTVAYFDGNRRALADLLRVRLPGIGYAMPEATYLAWLDCTGLGLGDDPAATFLEGGRVALNPGTDYGPEEGAGFARLNFGTARPILAEIVDRMARALEGAGGLEGNGGQAYGLRGV